MPQSFLYTDDKRKDLVRRTIAGETAGSIAKRYGVSATAIYSARKTKWFDSLYAKLIKEHIEQLERDQRRAVKTLAAEFQRQIKDEEDNNQMLKE